MDEKNQTDARNRSYEDILQRLKHNVTVFENLANFFLQEARPMAATRLEETIARNKRIITEAEQHRQKS